MQTDNWMLGAQNGLLNMSVHKLWIKKAFLYVHASLLAPSLHRESTESDSTVK